jgi:hypothetical protein
VPPSSSQAARRSSRAAPPSPRRRRRRRTASLDDDDAAAPRKYEYYDDPRGAAGMAWSSLYAAARAPRPPRAVGFGPNGGRRSGSGYLYGGGGRGAGPTKADVIEVRED